MAPMKDHPVVLTGNIVRLEPLTPDHVPDLMRIALAHIDEFAYTSTPTDAAQGESYFGKAFRGQSNDTDYPFVMLAQSSSKIIGTTRYADISWFNRHCELGYTWFDPAYFGTAVNVESKLLMLSHLFEELDFLRVQMNVDSRNVRSQAAIRALGATYEGTLRHHKFSKDGYLRDSLVFSVLRAEWEVAKAGLQSRLEQKLARA